MRISRPNMAVGIPSFREAGRISFVVKQIDAGLREAFDPAKCVIVNMDSYSDDGTNAVFEATSTRVPKRTLWVPGGKGRAMLAFFAFCVRSGIPFCVTIDADLRSIKPSWVPQLVAPIAEGADFTIPVYTRNRFEANITNQFAFPLLASVYKADLRQPLGGEFGFSRRFCSYLLSQQRHRSTLRYGIDMFITCNAIAGGFSIEEVYLGSKIHAPSFYHMESTFRQVFESGLFVTNLHRRHYTENSSISLNERSSGIDPYKYFPHKAAIPRLLRQLRKRFNRYRDRQLYDRYIEPGIIVTIAERINCAEPRLDLDLWIRTLGSFVRAYYERPVSDGTLGMMSRILFPIYRLRAISYWLQVENACPEEAEAEVLRGTSLLKVQLGLKRDTTAHAGAKWKFA